MFKFFYLLFILPLLISGGFFKDNIPQNKSEIVCFYETNETINNEKPEKPRKNSVIEIETANSNDDLQKTMCDYANEDECCDCQDCLIR